MGPFGLACACFPWYQCLGLRLPNLREAHGSEARDLAGSLLDCKTWAVLLKGPASSQTVNMACSAVRVRNLPPLTLNECCLPPGKVTGFPPAGVSPELWPGSQMLFLGP